MITFMIKLIKCFSVKIVFFFCFRGYKWISFMHMPYYREYFQDQFSINGLYLCLCILKGSFLRSNQKNVFVKYYKKH